MKSMGIILAITLLGAGLAQGQYGYQYLSGGYWFGAQFIGQEGWMVGAKGNILHTIDGGRNWIPQRNIEMNDIANPLIFSDVTFKNSQTGWACIIKPIGMPSPGYIVWRTTDGGLSWRAGSQPLTFWCKPSRITFADTRIGWLAGGIIFISLDGGGLWFRQDTSHEWLGIYAASSTKCWAVGDSGWTARTADGGTTWIKQQAGINSALLDVFFRDTLNGWACGTSGAIIHTTDGGATWTTQNSQTAIELCRIRFLSPLRGIAIGDSGTILKTDDGGVNWNPQSYSPNDLTAISFGDSLHGWVIGEGGTTVETSDGGQTWRVTRQGTTERIQAVSFADDQTGWSSTWEGNIWATQDGGKVWRTQASVKPGRLQSISFANATTGWAVGDSGTLSYAKHLILGTKNGGATWEIQGIGALGTTLKDVFASDVQNAWTIGNGYQNMFIPELGFYILGTNDGGQTWNEHFCWPDTGLNDISFCDSVHGWGLFQDGHVLRTTNRGQSWKMEGKVGSGNWYHLNFVDSLWGWVAGDSGISHSTDGGRSWGRQNSGGGVRLRDVSGVSRQRAWAVGDSGYSYGKILKTSDGGVTWLPQDSPVSPSWYAVDFVDSLRGVVGGWNAIINTTDGGVTWIQSSSGHAVYAITLVDSAEGWAGGVGWILHTTDGGRSWQSGIVGGHLRSISFTNRDEGWAGGGDGTFMQLLHTTDRGNSWYETRRLGGPIQSLCFIDTLQAWYGLGSDWEVQSSYSGRMMFTRDRGQNWKLIGSPKMSASSGDASSSRFAGICGSNGLLLRALDGSTWERVMGPTTSNLWGIGFGDQQTGWAVGWKGLRMATTDQGMNWQIQRQDALPDSLLMSVQAFDGLTARATGYLGRSVLTTDGGTTWQGEETGTKEWLLASSFLTPTLGWVAGENGMVLKYGRLPYGVEEGEKTTGAPRVTWLGPNHPNPFTGGTEIKYQLASRGKAKLGVYNVLGQAIRELVSGEQEAGTYSIRWDGKDGAGKATSSGVYFYRLEAFGQSQTRKMVKIR